MSNVDGVMVGNDSYRFQSNERLWCTHFTFSVKHETHVLHNSYTYQWFKFKYAT